MSEYPPFTPPLQYHFPERNRIISGLGRCLVVVEAPEKSGALITADFALEQGREVFVVSDCLSGREGAGTRKLFEEGARAVKNGREVLFDWGYRGELRGNLPAENRANPGKALADLLEEELNGRLVKYNGEYFRRN